MKKEKNEQISTARVLGGRELQEDRLIVRKNSKGILMAVADGHNGPWTADYVITNFAKKFLGSLPSCSDAGEAFRKVFAELAVETREHDSGTTLSCVYIHKAFKRAYVATIGDSPIIICSPGGFIYTSPDHNVRTNLEERERCIARRGWYQNGYIMSNTVRDVGLQMARALGDSEMGDVIERVPEISFVDLQSGSVVVVASDGVFDPRHLSANQGICRIAGRVLEGATAKNIVDESPGKKYDNATAIVWRMG
ncbi:MAG: PP2C family serine/threonine-protein phosphatase [Patescibacteria group bacterium]